jgi:hypothetical protein
MAKYVRHTLENLDRFFHIKTIRAEKNVVEFKTRAGGTYVVLAAR